MIERALVVGLGSIGQRHLALLRKRLPQAQLMVLRRSCDGTTAEADFCTTLLDEAVGFSPQIAIVANPAPFHAEVTVALAENGIHVLVEKPMASSVADAQKMIEAAAASDVVLQVGYNLRFLESLGAFRRLILDGKIGRVASARAEAGQYLPNWRPGSNWRDTVSAQRKLGGGVLFELSHEIDYLHWIFGRISSVRGYSGQLGGLAIDVEDTAHALLHFEADSPISGTGAALIASVSLDFIRHDTVRRCQAIGESGTLLWDGMANKISYWDTNGVVEVVHKSDVQRNDTYTAQLDSFLASVLKREQPLVNGFDGLVALNVIDGVRRSNGALGRELNLGTL